MAIDASYVPCDSVADLANALALILKGGPEATVSWNEEPIRYDFRFSQSRDGVHVVVMRLRGSGRPSNGGDELLSERGTALDIVRSFWRALRRLESSMPPDEYHAAWGYSFPAAKVKEITALIKQAEADGASE